MKHQLTAKNAAGFLPPHPTWTAMWILRHFDRLYLRLGKGTRELRIINPSPLHDAYREFQAGNTRLLVLFRHVDVADGPVVMSALTAELRRYDRTLRPSEQLPRKPHAHFLYGKDVLNWAGAGARWLFPRIGGIPVANTRLDRQSHQAIREVILRGDHPLALAPEGQVTYQMFRVSELTAGAGTMAHWIERDLLSAARTAPDDARERPGIVLLPMAIGYHLAADHGAVVEEALSRLEAAVGMRVPTAPTRTERVLSVTDLMLSLLAELYTDAYSGVFKGVDLETIDRSARIERLCDLILRCAELGVVRGHQQSILRRLFGARFRSSDIRYREDIDVPSLAPAVRAWADFRTLSAWSIDRHVQIVDVLMYLDPSYIGTERSRHRLAEYALNLLDLANRLSGGNIDSRYSPRSKRARILVGEPIDAATVLRQSSRSPKRAITALNKLVHEALVSLSADLEGRMVSEQPR